MTEEEAERIRATIDEAEAKKAMLVTTEKDWARLTEDDDDEEADEETDEDTD